MLGSLGPKEFKKAFIDFYHSFLDKHSVRDTFKGAPSPNPLGSHPAPPNLHPAEGSVKGGLARPVGDLVPAWLSIHCSSHQSIIPTCCLGYHPFIPSWLPLHRCVLPFTPFSLLSRSYE